MARRSGLAEMSNLKEDDFSPGAEDAYWNPPNQGTTLSMKELTDLH